jgi:hypothetical protein
MNFVTWVIGKESAVASIAGLHEVNVGIGEKLGPRLRGQANEGIVQGMEDKGGNGDAIYHTGAGGLKVVVVGISKAPVAGNDLVVELTD